MKVLLNKNNFIKSICDANSPVQCSLLEIQSLLNIWPNDIYLTVEVRPISSLKKKKVVKAKKKSNKAKARKK